MGNRSKAAVAAQMLAESFETEVQLRDFGVHCLYG